jgi:iodotyrosine deiodinase
MDWPYTPLVYQARSDEEMAQAAAAFERRMELRRSVRSFSDRPVPRGLIEAAIRTASSAPSGAHMQPWTFVAVSNPGIKRTIRQAAEQEEFQSYEGGRMPEEWLEALAPLGTDWNKPFLETAPWLVAVFAQSYGHRDDGSKKTHYYVRESVGIACGFFITALHEMGLVTLTHTPSPMGFLGELLQRPPNEKAFILFPVGYPAADATVPVLERKPLDEVSVFFT